MNVKAIAAIAILGTLGAGVALLNAPPPGQGDQAASMLHQAVTPQATMAGYTKVKNGMTLAQVQAAVGHPGQESGQASTGGMTMATHLWTNPDGSSLAVTFENGKVTGKNQSGLR